METNVNYTIVGAFVIILSSAIVLSIIWLSSGFSVQEYSTYLVYMQESVSGLNIDSPVEFNGVTVGNVKSISINRDNPRLVEVLLNVKVGTPITQGTLATLNIKGLTGVGFIALKDLGKDIRPLTRLANQPYPVIRTAPSLFSRLDTSLSNLTQSLQKVSDAITSLLDKQNQQSLKQILTGWAQFSKALGESSNKLTVFFNSGTRSAEIFETQTLPATNRAIDNISDISQGLSGITAEINENPAILIRGKTPQPLGPGEK